MLLTALMPTLSRAFASEHAADSVLLQICSASGLKFAKSPGSEPSGKQGGMMSDCPYCRVHADLPALPPAPLALPRMTLASERPALFYLAPTPLHAWIVANPRGPPA